MNSEELNQYIDDLLDGELSEAEFLKLEAEMHVNADARQTYYERLQLHTALFAEAAESRENVEEKVIAFPSANSYLPWFAAAAAALAFFAGGLGWQIGKSGDANVAGAPEEEPVAQGFAVIGEQSDAVWETEASLGHGDLLPSGPLRLASGIVQIDFFSGVTAIIEGDAEFEILSDMEMQVNKGKLRATVPEPAQGFQIRTSTGNLVDLGTEFALTVTPDHADMHVLNGEIEWHPVDKPMRTLIDGESLRWTASGDAVSTPADSEVIDVFDLKQHLSIRRSEKRAQWQFHVKEMKKDPRLLVHLPIDGESDNRRELINDGRSGKNGTIVRAQWAADRWGESESALDFSPTGSRVRLDVPGKHRSLTFHCWARIDSLDRWYNSLFLTDGHELHEPHWQIMQDGRLFFSVKANEARKKHGDKHIAFSPPIWTPADSGKWFHIATVYDGDVATTTHYVNGKKISHDVLPDNMRVEEVSIGAASIGNWSEPSRDDPHFAVRNLNGVIDEFAIFSAALTAEEIQKLYQIGKP